MKNTKKVVIKCDDYGQGVGIDLSNLPPHANKSDSKVKDKPLFNSKIVSDSYTTYTKYKITCYLYHDDGKTRRPNRHLKDFETHKLSGVCFSGLLKALSKAKFVDSKHYNRLCYTIEWPDEADKLPFTKLTTEERKAWVKLCKTYKLLPSYITPDVAEDGVLVLKLTDSLPPSLLYCYLAAFRCLREQTGFVKAMLYLTKEKKMNFYAAFVLASFVTVCNSGTVHHIGEWGRPYMPSTSHIDKIQILARDIIAFKRFLQNPAGLDNRTVYNANEGWRCKYYMLNQFKNVVDKAIYQKKFSAAELLNTDVIKELGV